eukprot:232409_1
MCCCCKDNFYSKRSGPKQALLEEDKKCDDNEEYENIDDIEEKEEERTFREWMSLVFWQFAGSSVYSKKNVYMTELELKSFLLIVNLSNDEDKSIY